MLRHACTASLIVAAMGCHRERPPAPNAEPAPATAVFGPTVPNTAPAPGPAPPGMVWIPGGEFSMGGSADVPDERPVHRVYVDGFWMDRTEITNAQFAEFVRATNYRTIAERTPRPEDLPGVPRDQLVAGSVVFTPPKDAVPLDAPARWWSYVKRASWRHPDGTRKTVDDKQAVVHIAYDDAAAYARWAGKRLPTEAEFEFAARGGLAGKRYAWGDELNPEGRWMANTFQGHFPDDDTGDDGWRGLAPVGSFPPNGYGLHDITGNVWEWCSDWYRPDEYAALAARGGVARNPTGPPASLDPSEPGVPKRVQRGGSFLCTSTYCTRYLVGARGRGDVATSASHVGFRCVKSGSGR